MTGPTLIKILLGEFYAKIDKLKNLVVRDAAFYDAPGKIKVAIGMRRTGKTYMVYQHILALLKQGILKTSILYINFEDDRLIPLNQQKLVELVDAFYALHPENHQGKCYLFFDEIQNVDDWALVMRRFIDSKDIEIFLTGSSAKLLSKEIATGLRGRSLATEIWPYSFGEYMRAGKSEVDRSLFDKTTHDILAHAFNTYMSNGGFPETVLFNPDVRRKVLQEYVDIVIYRDVIERHNIKNPTVIKRMIMAMIHNVGRPFSINKFYNELKSQGYAIGKEALYEYAAHLEDAYLIFSVSLYAQSMRKSQTASKKLYAIDPGLVRSLTFDYENDVGRLFENIVYLDLRRLGYQVNYYVTREGNEVDFLVQTQQGHKRLLQVAWNMDDAKTVQREERALREGMDELKVDGEIITLDSYLEKGVAP